MRLELVFAGLGALGAAPAEDPLPAVSYVREVEPLLRRACFGCHQPAKAKGKLDLTSHAALMAGGRGGPAVVPGAPAESLLLELVLPFDGEPPEMPEDAEPLGEVQTELLRRWIAEGAEDDTPPGAAPPFDAEHPPVYSRPPALTDLDHSPDGEWLAVSGYHEVLVGAADFDAPVARLIGLSPRVESLAYSPDGTLLAVTGGTPGLAGELQLWRTSDWSLRRSTPVTHDTVYGVSWSPDGKLVAVGGADTTLRAFDVESGAEVLYQAAHADWVLGTTFSSDGSHLCSVGRDRSLKLTKVATQQFIDNITSITPGVLKGGLQAVERHPERDELLVGGADGAPKTFRMYREKKRVIGDDYNLIRAFEPLAGRVFDVAWTPDGAGVLAVSSASGGGALAGEVRRFDAEKGELNWKVKLPSGIYSLDVHPTSGRLVVGGADGRLRWLELADGTLVEDRAPWPVATPTSPKAVEASVPRPPVGGEEAR